MQRGFNWLAALLASGLCAVVMLIVWLALRITRSMSAFIPAAAGDANGAGLLARMRPWLFGLLQSVGLIRPPQRRRIAFYDELLRLLEAHELPKPCAATPLEFAQETRRQLEHLPGGAAVCSFPAELVERFYRVRFGREDLSDPESERVHRMLRSLQEALSHRRTQ
jgi:hypothetical protein